MEHVCIRVIYCKRSFFQPCETIEHLGESYFGNERHEIEMKVTGFFFVLGIGASGSKESSLKMGSSSSLPVVPSPLAKYKECLTNSSEAIFMDASEISVKQKIHEEPNGKEKTQNEANIFLPSSNHSTC